MVRRTGRTPDSSQRFRVHFEALHNQQPTRAPQKPLRPIDDWLTALEICHTTVLARRRAKIGEERESGQGEDTTMLTLARLARGCILIVAIGQPFGLP